MDLRRLLVERGRAVQVAELAVQVIDLALGVQLVRRLVDQRVDLVLRGDVAQCTICGGAAVSRSQQQPMQRI